MEYQSLTSVQQNLLKAPPCPAYKDLRTIETLKGFESKFDGITCKADVKAANDEIKVFLSAAKQLSASLKRSVTELEKATANCKEAAEASEKKIKKQTDAAKKEGKAKKTAKFDSAGSVFQEVGIPIEAVAVDTDPFKEHILINKGEDIDVPAPYIITAVKWAIALGEALSKPAADDEAGVTKCLRMFEEDFLLSDVRRTTGRCMRSSVDEDTASDDAAKDFLAARMLPLCPRGTIGAGALAEEEHPLKKIMALSNFAVKQGSCHAYVDKGKLASMRIAVRGTRLIAMMPLASVVAYMNELNVTSVTPANFVKSMRKESASEYVKNHKLYVATLGAGEFLYIPAHFIVYENVSEQVDVLGLRASIVVKRDKSAMAEMKKEASSPSTPADAPCKHVIALAAA